MIGLSETHKRKLDAGNIREWDEFPCAVYTIQRAWGTQSLIILRLYNVAYMKYTVSNTSDLNLSK